MVVHVSEMGPFPAEPPSCTVFKPLSLLSVSVDLSQTSADGLLLVVVVVFYVIH